MTLNKPAINAFKFPLIPQPPMLDKLYTIQCYRVIALISVNIVPSWDIEGLELAYIAINISYNFLILNIV